MAQEFKQSAGWGLHPNHITPDRHTRAIRALIQELGIGGRPVNVALLERNHAERLAQIEAGI